MADDTRHQAQECLLGWPAYATSIATGVENKALKKAGLRRIRIHDLRHTYASLLIQAGESLAYVRDQLGHHSIKVTVDIYGHLDPEGNKQAVDKLDDVLPMHLDAPSPHPAPPENKQALRRFHLSA